MEPLTPQENSGSLMDTIRNEPVAILGFINACVGLAAAFGWVEIDSARSGAVAAVWAAFSTLLVRQQVSPNGPSK
jgi:hypothetical protein